MVVMSVLALFLAKTFKQYVGIPLEASLVAILLGLLLRNAVGIPQHCEAGVKAFEKLLVVGIVLIGATLNIKTLMSEGARLFLVVVLTMKLSFIVIYLLARWFRLSEGLASLLAVGTTICGGTAIAIVSPLIKAKEEETSYAIGVVALWGLLAIIIYPKVAAFFGASDFVFGVFAGTSIHSTPQVVGAGFIYSEMAGKTATAVKLVRNCFLLPVALGMATWASKRQKKKQNEKASFIDVARIFPWFLFGYFILAAMNTSGFLSAEVIAACKTAGKFLILVGLAGIGLNTHFSAFRSVGLKPLVVGFMASVVVGVFSLTLIHLIL